MRVAIGGISHETSTFTTVATTRESFAERSGFLRGQEMLEKSVAILASKQHPQPAVRARENLVQVLVNHNNFVTILAYLFFTEPAKSKSPESGDLGFLVTNLQVIHLQIQNSCPKFTLAILY